MAPGGVWEAGALLCPSLAPCVALAPAAAPGAHMPGSAGRWSGDAPRPLRGLSGLEGAAIAQRRGQTCYGCCIVCTLVALKHF